MGDNETGKNTGEMAASAWGLGEMTRRELAVVPAKDEGVKDPCILIGTWCLAAHAPYRTKALSARKRPQEKGGVLPPLPPQGACMLVDSAMHP